MKKLASILIGLAAIVALHFVFDTAHAAPILQPPGGGLGTNIVPASGTIPIGNGAGTYTPATLTQGTNITITNGSGTITIAASGGGGSSVATTTINGQQCPSFSFSIVGTTTASSITTSTCNLFWNLLTYSSGTDINVAANGQINFVNTPGFISAAILSVNGNTNSAQTFTGGAGISVVSGSGNTTTTNTGVTSFNNATGSVTGVGSFNGSTGTINYNDTTSGAGITSTVATSGGNTTTTFKNIGVTSLNNATGSITIQGSGSTTVSIAGQTITINSTSSAGGLAAAVTSINTATSSAQTIVATSTGIAVVTTPGVGNSTTTIQNTGVTSLAGNGCVGVPNSTGTITLSVTCISGNQTITFVASGDATGTASGATSINDSITVTGLNGKALPANTTGTLQFVGNAWRINLATSSLGVYDASGTLSSFAGSSYNPSPSCVTSVVLSASGTLSGTSGACSGGGSGATTTINQVNGPTFTIALVATTSPSSVTTSTAIVNLNVTNQVQVPTIIVSSRAGANFASSSLALATVAACNTSTYPNGATVELVDSAAYVVTSTAALPPLRVCNNLSIVGPGFRNTYIDWQAPSFAANLFATSGTALTAQNVYLSGFTLVQTSSTDAGNAVNASNWGQSTVEKIETIGFHYPLVLNDTLNFTFYDHFNDWISYDASGIFASSTNSVNTDYFSNFQVNPNQDGSGSAGSPAYGIYANNTQSLNFSSFACEPATEAGSVCVDFQTANAEDAEFDTLYVENASSAVVLGNGVKRMTFVNANLNNNLTNVVDQGSVSTNWINYDNNFGTQINQLGSVNNALITTNGTGVMSGYGGSSCSAGQAPNTISALGAFGGCFTPSGGSGSGNLFVSPTSTTIANNVVKFQTSGSSTVAQTSSIYSFSDGNMSVNTSTEKGIVNIINASTSIPVLQISTSTLATSSPALNILGSSSTATTSFSVFQVLGDGHLDSTGTLPVLSSCGTNPTITGTDAAGVVTVGTVSATGCTITFQIPYEATPSCIVTNESMSITAALTYTESTTALTLSQATGLVGDKVHYFCSETI